MSIKERIALTQEDVANLDPVKKVNKVMEKELRHSMLLESRLVDRNELADLDS